VDVASLEQALRACGAASDWMQSDAAVWWDAVSAQGMQEA